MMMMMTCFVMFVCCCVDDASSPPPSAVSIYSSIFKLQARYLRPWRVVQYFFYQFIYAAIVSVFFFRLSEICEILFHKEANL